MLKKDHFDDISPRDIFLFVNSEAFLAVFVFVLIILFLEGSGLAAFKSDLLLNALLIFLVGIGFIDIFFGPEKRRGEDSEGGALKLGAYVFLLASVAGFLTYVSLAEYSSLAMLISFFMALVTLLITLYLLVQDD